MKHVLALLILASNALAIPQLINYQGQLTSAGGVPLDTTVSLTFALYVDDSGGAPLWDETHVSVAVVDGIFNVVLGSILPVPNIFNDDAWLGISVGSDSEMEPRQQMVSVPHAYRVATVDAASGGYISSTVDVTGNLLVGSTNNITGVNSLAVGSGQVVNGSLSSISGGANNNVSSSATYSHIGGGLLNAALNTYATVGGGQQDTASGNGSTVAGGIANKAAGLASFVGGGDHNLSSQSSSVIAGGSSNTASGNNTVVAGGANNIASGLSSTVGGGSYVKARGNYSVVSGGGGNSQADSNSAVGTNSAISGGKSNLASGDYSVVGGGNDNASTESYSSVLGGTGNNASGTYSSIGGGTTNSVLGPSSSIGGGNTNSIGSGSQSSVIAGGRLNSLSGDYCAILSGRGSSLTGTGSVICGGYDVGIPDSANVINSDHSFIGTGIANRIDSSRCATIGGGNYNVISPESYNATIAGGIGNEVGLNSSAAAIGGGYFNAVHGDYSVVPGGFFNSVTGNYSFAAGKNVQCTADHAFAFGDGSETFTPGSNNTASFLTIGGFRIWTANPVSSNIGTRLAAGGTSWVALSDSNMKTNRAHVDGESVLQKISSMPIDHWNYKHQSEGPAHIGPMAQDFWSAFHLGSDSLGIETIDADGVLFAAIQELAKRSERIGALEAEVADLRQLVEQMIQLGHK